MERPWLKRTEICSHTEEERCMIGTWCTPELQKAVALGYKIIKIYEVWHFPEDQRRVGLFADYMSTNGSKTSKKQQGGLKIV